MRTVQLSIMGLLALVAMSATAQAHPPRGGWSVGINIGPPAFYRPWGYWGYYRPYPVLVEAPPTVIVRPAPIVVRESPVVVQESPAVVQENPGPTYRYASPPSAPVPVQGDRASTVNHHVQLLTHGDETVRRDAVMELGRMKATSTVDSLAATLAGDRSPLVRDAAARALGLIASQRALPALTHAAQADSDRDVRRSAQFAMEVIHSQLRK